MNDMCYYINVIQHDATLVSLKKKQADSISEMYVFNIQMKMRLVSKFIIQFLWQVRADGPAEQDESQVFLIDYYKLSPHVKILCRVSKDCSQIANEIGDVRAATDEVARSKVRVRKGDLENQPNSSGFR